MFYWCVVQDEAEAFYDQLFYLFIFLSDDSFIQEQIKQ